jgi:hypothetical protein
MATSPIAPQIDPETGERIKPAGTAPVVRIDPQTGERIKSATSVSGAQGSRPAQPQLMPAETGIVPTLKDAGEDLLHGGTRTMLGRGLGHLQGRGDKGYGGLDSGVSPETAQFMGSPELGTLKMAQGGAEIGTGHPLTGGGHLLSGALQASTIPASFFAPEAADAAIEMIPSRAHAGHIFGEISEAAKDVPVIPRATAPAISRFNELREAGGQSVKPLNSLARRTTEYLTPATKEPQEPMLFPEARDRYSLVSDASKQNPLQTLLGRGLKPTMLRQAGEVRDGLNSDLTDAANQIGRGEDYTNALKEYAQASKLRKGLLLGGAAVGEEALRRSGILGKTVGAITR